ncbi:bifunctional riboflavin kinase/FAD synthetase [Methylonatrum kenyense]|uniref:bifunctional riboflavin kinase/FAD synthetase n=1 Tax=Methylonatrum kenyense TaxID=455253 RepID=UPI0020C132E7|nr:bifunctional riboflavin kinase/FAD synthetase [Methylonatrum kenyense]MCK8516316.1 bifunctional riboflavin kinase/FAD synthetase [Methylonatrum kenyense]
MEMIRGLHNLRPRHRGCVATIGNFDGVHRGHQRILQALRESAAERSLPATVISFEPDPHEFFSPESAPPRLTSLRDKCALLAGAGVRRFLCLHFDRRLAAMTSAEFIRRILVEGLAVRHLLVGDDFRFARGRAGDFRTLSEDGRKHGFSVARTPTVNHAGGRVSSTRIRRCLAAGDLAAARDLLGRDYAISGRVIHGDRIGRELGYPTANIAFRRRPPMDGVLAAEVRIERGAPQPAVVSVGTRPTVNGKRPLLEVHLLDFSGSLYGRHLEVTFRHWLRGQQRFPDLDGLRAQLERDAQAARDWFSTTGT